MQNDLQKAISLLKEENFTCVAVKGDALYTSCSRGVKPLLTLLQAGKTLEGYAAADKVVGKATAFLYCLLGAAQVHALVISRPALKVLEENGIAASYDVLVDFIENRQKNGPCPMDYAVRDVVDAKDAPAAILAALAKLQQA